MNGVTILSVGTSLPKKCVTNDELSKTVDTNDEWIRSRSGIGARYICDENETTYTMAIEAGRRAIEKAGINKEDIAMVAITTSSSDYLFPMNASMVQAGLGLNEEIMSFDLTAACSGLIYAIELARGYLTMNNKKYALIIGSEHLTRITDYTDRSTCILFGDAGGAIIVGLNEGAAYASKQWTRGNFEVLWCAGASGNGQKIHMNGKEVFKFAVDAMDQGIKEVLEAGGQTLDDVKYIICHQANLRIIDHVKKRYKGHEHKFFSNIEKYANTSTASIPIVLEELFDKGELNKGDKIVLVGFGAGLVWGSALIEL